MKSQLDIVEAIERKDISLAFAAEVEIELSALEQRIAALESQLAAQAAAVEVLGKVDNVLFANQKKFIRLRMAPSGLCVIGELRGSRSDPSDATVYMDTSESALAALVAAAGKEDGK